MAYLNSLASHKERVEKLLVTKEVNSACIYRVKFFLNGLRTSVVVDDFVPILPVTQLPAFCSSENQLFWAMLSEKAWAKINGGYFKIKNGKQSFLSIHITGMPAEHMQHNSSTKIFKNGVWSSDIEKQN